jgi:hypothetical protein
MPKNEAMPFRTKNVSPRNGEMVKPHELIGIAGHESWSLAERRAWNLLLVNAWGDNLDQTGAVFSIELRELRGLHDSNDRIRPSLRRFQQTLVAARLPDGKTRTVQLLGATDMDEEDREDGILVYDFHPKLIELLRDSELYARMQMKVIAAFSSKYALSLYEVISARIELKHKSSEVVDVETLRMWLGVEAGKLKRWPDFRRMALELAVREVNALSPFTVKAEPIKRGKRIAEVRLSWAKKEPFSPAEKAAVREVNRAKAGRKARVAGTVEQVVPELSPSAIEKGYEAAAPICRIDKYRAVQLWEDEVAGYAEPPSNPTGHFIEFCKRIAREVG